MAFALGGAALRSPGGNPVRHRAGRLSATTYALVSFIDRKALGGVASVIGAGGNVGTAAAGFPMKGVGSVQFSKRWRCSACLLRCPATLTASVTMASANCRAHFAGNIKFRDACGSAGGGRPYV